jgi:hypothetical protein
VAGGWVGGLVGGWWVIQGWPSTQRRDDVPDAASSPSPDIGLAALLAEEADASDVDSANTLSAHG